MESEVAIKNTVRISSTTYDQESILSVNIYRAYLPMLQCDTKRKHYHVPELSCCCGYNYPCTGLDRPLELQGVETLRISKQSAHYGGQVVSPTHQSLLSPEDIPSTHFC